MIPHPILSADPAAHRAHAAACRSAGQALHASAAECGAAALEAGSALGLYNIGAAFLMASDAQAAEPWFRLALQLDPALPVAHQNLASILDDAGQADAARRHRRLAYRRQCVFVAPAPDPRRRVLVLTTSGRGNIPLKHLLPATATRITCVAEFATAATVLPPYDLVLNAIGDADLAGPTSATVRRLLRTGARFLNHPDAVAHTRRDRLPQRLAGLPGVRTPPVRRIRRPSRLASGFPLLLRPVGSHGGEGVHLAHATPSLPDGAWYASPFVETRSADGFWRKYRVVFVAGVPYPYHLAIAPHWLAHYATADMAGAAHWQAEERRFLEQPESALGTRGMAAIAAIGARLGLDYAGVDFTLLPDGDVLVFEANATMLVHPEAAPEFAYKNPAVHRIVAAFAALLA